MQESIRALAMWAVVAAFTGGMVWRARGEPSAEPVATPRPASQPQAATELGGPGAATTAAADGTAEVEGKPVDASFAFSHLTRLGQVNLDTGQVSCIINIQGAIVAPAGSKILSASNEVVVTEALDQDGVTMLHAEAEADLPAGADNIIRTRPMVRIVRGNVRGMRVMGAEMRQPITINLPQLNGRPTGIKSLKGFGTITVAVRQQVKVIDAVVSSEYQKLGENCEFKVESINLQQNGGNVVLMVRKSGDPQRAFQAIWEAPVIEAVDLVDDQGNATASQSLNQNPAGQDGERILIRAQASFNAFGRALQNTKTIRLTLATKVREQKVPFAVKDVPLP